METRRGEDVTTLLAIYAFGAVVEWFMLARLWYLDPPAPSTSIGCALLFIVFVGLWPLVMLPTIRQNIEVRS